jgi:hypothetical protein
MSTNATIDLNSLIKDVRTHNQGAERQYLTEKWNKTGLLKGLKDDYARENMSVILENQLKELIKESSQTSDITGFQNNAFPIVRRAFGNLLAQELVSVQAMNLPSGLIFYLDFTYGAGQCGYTQGGSVYGDPVGSCLHTSGAAKTGGLYDLHSAYSQMLVSGTYTLGTGWPTSSGSAPWASVSFDPDLSGSTVYENVFGLTGITSTACNGALDASAVKSITVASSSATVTPGPFQGIPTQYRRHNVIRDGAQLYIYTDHPIGPSASICFVCASTASCVAAPCTTGGVGVYQPFESDMGVNPTPTIPEIDIKLESATVVAQTRKLRARWTPELAQDLNAYFNIDAEAELTQILSEQIALEIDREIIGDLMSRAAITRYWSKQRGKYVNPRTGATIGGSFTTTSPIEWYRGLFEVIVDASNEIFARTKRGNANWIVASPDVCTVIESVAEFKPAYTGDAKEVKYSIGTEKVGTLNNRFTVYKDPYMIKNQVLLGYKGNSFLECGYVYAPYIPLIITPTIFAPEDFTPRKGLLTRYGKHMVRPDYFAKIIVEDL